MTARSYAGRSGRRRKTASRSTAASAVWAYLMMVVILLWIAGTVLHLPVPIEVPTLLPRWTGILIGTTCLLQVGLGMALDARVEKGLLKYYFWMIWYPIVYWVITAATAVAALPKIIFRDSEKRARWTSPDRGIKPPSR